MRKLAGALAVIAAIALTAAPATAIVGIGSNGADRMAGTARTDRLYGRGGADTLYGMAGDDYLNGGRGHDELHGGAGFDRCVVDAGDVTRSCEVVRIR